MKKIKENTVEKKNLTQCCTLFLPSSFNCKLFNYKRTSKTKRKTRQI